MSRRVQDPVAGALRPAGSTQESHGKAKEGPKESHGIAKEGPKEGHGKAKEGHGKAKEGHGKAEGGVMEDSVNSTRDRWVMTRNG